MSVKGGEYWPMYQIFDSKYALSDYCCFVMCELSQFVTPLGGCGHSLSHLWVGVVHWSHSQLLEVYN